MFQLILKKLIKKIIIAIDGYSSTGKSTLAKMLSKHLKYKHINTGSMYRAVTLFAMKNNWVYSLNNQLSIDRNSIVASIDNLNLDFKLDHDNCYRMYMDNEDVEKEIKTEEVSSFVSEVSKDSSLRKKIVFLQKNIGKERGVVMEGRDIGSVVFPDAELKLFITASLKVRATRRYQELLKLGIPSAFQDVFKNLKMRDFIDSNRKNSPLIKVQDAVLIDNTLLNLEDQFNLVLELLGSKKNLL